MTRAGLAPLPRWPRGQVETRICAWCQGECPTCGPTFTVRGSTRRKRFCCVACSRKAGGITHDEHWAKRMTELSTLARQHKARALADQQLQAGVTGRQLYEKGYQAGWRAGRTRALKMYVRRIQRKKAA